MTTTVMGSYLGLRYVLSYTERTENSSWTSLIDHSLECLASPVQLTFLKWPLANSKLSSRSKLLLRNISCAFLFSLVIWLLSTTSPSCTLEMHLWTVEMTTATLSACGWGMRIWSRICLTTFKRVTFECSRTILKWNPPGTSSQQLSWSSAYASVWLRRERNRCLIQLRGSMSGTDSGLSYFLLVFGNKHLGGWFNTTATLGDMFIVLWHSAVLENTTSQGYMYYLLHDVSDDFEQRS